MFEKLKEKQMVDLLLRLQDRDWQIRAGTLVTVRVRWSRSRMTDVLPGAVSAWLQTKHFIIFYF